LRNRIVGIVPDRITIHPDKPEWKNLYPNTLNVVEDSECIWSDGSIGGYCTEFYKDGIEIGNIVNTLGNCIDVGFGLQRLEQILNLNQPTTREQVLQNTCLQLIKEGISPANTLHGYVLKKLLIELFISNGNINHIFFTKTKESLVKRLELYNRIKHKNLDKSDVWWWDTHGIDVRIIERLK